jgi:hypothetical protein
MWRERESRARFEGQNCTAGLTWYAEACDGLLQCFPKV